MILIKDRAGMKTWRSKNAIIKEAIGEKSEAELRNAYRFLKALADTPYVPKNVSLSVNGNASLMLIADFVERQPVTNPDLALWHVTHLLYLLRKKGIIHGDLTAPNIIWNNNCPVVFDWDESVFSLSDNRKGKRQEPDILHLLPAYIGETKDLRRIARRWLAIRSFIGYYLGWGSLVDMGTDLGYFCGLAAADGMTVTGVDKNCKLKGAWHWWGNMGLPLVHQDIAAYVNELNANVVLLLSTWAYLVEEKGKAFACEVLQKCIENSDILAFETQLAGDGPGPEFLKSKEDVVDLLYANGAGSVEEAISVPIDDRGVVRTTFIVK